MFRACFDAVPSLFQSYLKNVSALKSVCFEHVSKNLKGALDAETIDTQWRDKSEGQTRDPTRRIRYKSHRCHSFARQHKPTRTILQTRPAGAVSVAFSKDSHSPRLDLTTYATLSTDGTIEPHSLCAPLKHAMMQDTIADHPSQIFKHMGAATCHSNSHFAHRSTYCSSCPVPAGSGLVFCVGVREFFDSSILCYPQR